MKNYCKGNKKNSIFATKKYICFMECFIKVISSIVAPIGFIFSALALWQNYRLNKKQKKDALNNKLSHILEIAVKYPYVEYQSFINQWIDKKDASDIRYMRYDMFCNLLFNFLAELYEFYGGNKKKMESFCDIKTWVRMHKLNWLYPIDPNENIDGYSENFRNFINSYIQ